MRSARFGLAAAILTMTATPVWTQQPMVVVELFTSQGCTACPPADAFLAELSEREDLIALAFHVDYWDALGWRDVYASPEFTRRQAEYGKMFGVARYTPQMIVQGGAEMVGHDRRAVGKEIRKARQEKPEIRLRVELPSGAARGRVWIEPIPAKIEATASLDEDSASALPTREAAVWLVGYDADTEVAILGGQNADRRLPYCNTVREWRALGIWGGVAPMSVEFDRPAGSGGVAVIVQENGVGPILGAAQIRYDD